MVCAWPLTRGVENGRAGLVTTARGTCRLAGHLGCKSPAVPSPLDRILRRQRRALVAALNDVSSLSPMPRMVMANFSRVCEHTSVVRPPVASTPPRPQNAHRRRYVGFFFIKFFLFLAVAGPVADAADSLNAWDTLQLKCSVVVGQGLPLGLSRTVASDDLPSGWMRPT
ncbi:hypothetical protein K456DRAFT_200495 [Colletotrichum gloeosporioides 23]|nr:hypothetical protein K456DRAFT_200495 [Colletotrichum gloeosporioides 23]